MPKLDHQVTEAEAGRTVKSVALKEMLLSRGMFSHLKFSGGLTLDGRPVRADTRLMQGQVLTARWEEPGGVPLTPYHSDLRIVYEDDGYIVVDKPAPLPTLCSARQAGPTLENALYDHLGCPEKYMFRPVNRLDKGTSGLLAVARSAHAQQLLQRQLHTDAFVREYLAVCRGRMKEETGTIDLPIGKAGEGPRREIRRDGQQTVTHYRVEAAGKDWTLLRLRLETGRTHQIRVHLSALGCPIVGDYLYGQADPRLPGRFALHACALGFIQPLTGERVDCVSPLPAALNALMEPDTAL